MSWTVLVVDDNPVVRRFICELFSRELDFNTYGEAGDGHEAIMKAQDLKPDLIVTDLSMPVMDGLEETRTRSNHCLFSAYGCLRRERGSCRRGLSRGRQDRRGRGVDSGRPVAIAQAGRLNRCSERANFSSATRITKGPSGSRESVVTAPTSPESNRPVSSRRLTLAPLECTIFGRIHGSLTLGEAPGIS